MIRGRYCRNLSTTRDDNIGRLMGNRDLDEFLYVMVHDAADPQQLRALAHQLLMQARRISIKEYRRRWKDAWREVLKQAEEAETRLATNPSRLTHPGFYSNRSVGRPGTLWDDLYLPLVFRLDLSGYGREGLFTGSYSDPLPNGTICRTGVLRSGDIHLTTDGGRHVKVNVEDLRCLQDLGRLVAMPLSAMPREESRAAA